MNVEMINAFEYFHPLSEKSKELIAPLIQTKEYPKGYHLVNILQRVEYFYFIEKGAARVYYLNNGEDITDYFAFDNMFVGAVPSLFTREPSEKGVELLEKCTIHFIDFSKLEELANTHHEICNLGRKMAITAFLDGQKRVEELRFLTVTKRYEQLLAKHPGITNRVSLKHIATYLGTTQVSLSRIRGGAH